MSSPISTRQYPWLTEACPQLERMIVGRTAQEILDRPGELPSSGAIAVFPAWKWRERPEKLRSAIPTRPELTDLLPVRVLWHPGPVLVVPSNQAVSTEWQTIGYGTRERDTVSVSCSATGKDDNWGTVIADPYCDTTLRARSKRDLYQALRRLADDAVAARWEMIMSLEPNVDCALGRAHRAVSRELGRGLLPVLDRTKLEAVRDRMLLGVGKNPGPVSRLIDRCVKDETFEKVAPLRYIATDLRRAAEEEVRRELGDPHIGRKVRALASETGLSDPQAIIDAYRERFPDDRLSVARLKASLTANAEIMASAVPFNDLIAAGEVA